MTESVPQSEESEKPINYIGWTQKVRILAIVALIVVISYLPIFMGQIFWVENHKSKNDVLFFLILPFLSFALMIFCPLLAAKRFPLLSSFDRTWTTKPRTKIRWFFLLGASILGSIIITGLLTKHSGWPTNGQPVYWCTSGHFATHLITKVLILVIAGPIAEEFLWRGYALRQFERTLGSFIALFLQSFLWAAVHFRPLMGFAQIFLWGLIFGIWRLKKRSLVPVIVAHMIINALLVAAGIPDEFELTKVKIKMNYVAKLNELGRPANPDDNAEPYYTKAADLYVPQPSELDEVDKNAWPGDLTAEQQEILKHWLGENENALTQLKHGTKKPDFWLEHQGSFMMVVVTPNLVKYKDLACTLCWRAKTQAAKGDFDTAIDDILTCYRLGGHFTRGPKTLIEQLVGIAIKGLTLKSGFSILDKTQVGIMSMAHLQNELELLSAKQSYYIDIQAEKLTMYDIIQRTFTDDGSGGGHIPNLELEQMKNPPAFLPVKRSFTEEEIEAWAQLERRQTTENADKLYAFMEHIARKTPAQQREEGIEFEKKAYEIIEGNGLLHMLTPAYGKVSELSHRSRVSIEALITTLVILRYEANEGQLPKTLDELIYGDYIKRLPMDPYSDKSLVYKPSDGTFTLYSFGADFDDDGGKHDDKWGADDGDYVFWPVKRHEKTTETKNDTPGN